MQVTLLLQLDRASFDGIGSGALFLLPLLDPETCGALERRPEEVRRAHVDAEVVQVVHHELADALNPLGAEVDVIVA